METSTRDSENPAITLVKQLIEEGKSFSIAVERTASGARIGLESLEIPYAEVLGDGECIKWVYVKDQGLVCVQRAVS